MIGNLINSVIDYALTSAQRRKQSEMIEREYENSKKDYDQRLAEARSVFDRNYYRTYMDKVDARKLMEQTQSQLRDRAQSLYNSAAVVGSVGGATGVLHRNNNQALQEVENSLYGEHRRQQQQARNVYESTQRSLVDYIRNAKKQREEQRNQLEMAKIGDKYNFLKQIL